MVFDTSHADAVPIRDEEEYNGVRVSLEAALSTAKMRFHVDVNVGDPIWPRPQKVLFPRLLGGRIEMLGYPIPMVLAEKIVTAAQRGITSTRWRDFADMYLLTGQHPLVAADVRAAISAVAHYRRSEVGDLRATLHGYAAAGQSRWLAWQAKQSLDDGFRHAWLTCSSPSSPLPTGYATSPGYRTRAAGRRSPATGVSPAHGDER